MPTDQPGAVVHQVLIQLRPEAAEGLGQTIRSIEDMNGRVLLSFPPNAIVASLASSGIEILRGEPSVLSVDVQEIAEARLEAASETARVAMIAWNQHLARQQAPQEPMSADLSWDAPGRLPPDPPLEIQEMLRRRERDMLGGGDEHEFP